jgi:hypothetical protein
MKIKLPSQTISFKDLSVITKICNELLNMADLKKITVQISNTPQRLYIFILDEEWDFLSIHCEISDINHKMESIIATCDAGFHYDTAYNGLDFYSLKEIYNQL